MANGTNIATLMDLSAHPLGSRSGENFKVAMNYQIPPARIYVVNHSRTRKWKRPIVPVSHLKGADEALQVDKELAKIYNAESLMRAAESGKDMTRYKFDIFPVAFQLRVPGGKVITVPCAKTAEDKPVAVEVPDGTWDLYLGNYNRMAGFATQEHREEGKYDARVAQDEAQRLNLWWRQRYHPVFKVTDDGESSDFGWGSGNGVNPHGFIEFVRVPQRSVTEPIDREYLTSLDVIEV